MSGVVTLHFRINTAEQFYEALGEASPDYYYIYIGRSFQFADDTSPPTPANSYSGAEYDPWRDMIGMKRIQTSDISFIAPRYNWTNNTLYTQYTDTQTSLNAEEFYVLQTDDYNVYKCIDNNRGANSTIKPTGTGTAIISTADNYRWKYMFNISSADRTAWLTLDYFPVKKLTADDSSDQWDVQQAAANGAIHQVDISANGTGYLSHTANVAAANSTAIKLATTAAANDAAYVQSAVYIKSGLGLGQIRRIVNYNGTTKYATVNSAFTTTPNTQSNYVVSPRVNILGDSGQTVSSLATAYVSNTAGGQVRKITVIAEGLNYSQGNVAITANGSHGSGATATPVISPPNGHGYAPVKELFAFNVMLNASMVGAEGNTLPTNNEFRTVGMIANPRLRAGSVANASLIDQCTRLTLNAVSGDYHQDEIITDSATGCTAKVVRFSNTNATGSKGVLRAIRVVTTGTGKTFRAGSTVSGANSSVTANVIAIARPALREYTGDIIYHENRQPIARAADQTERIKVIVKF